MTQLGHVQDLAYAMASILGNKKALAQVYNISGERYVTFNGIARACAKAIGKSPDHLKLVHYNPKDFDFGKKKAFPLRTQHFFADISKAKMDLDWQPQYDLISGLKESFEKDYLVQNRHEAEIDFSLDDQILST
jgi:nucleoside-diphosphate-sugar epimerase